MMMQRMQVPQPNVNMSTPTPQRNFQVQFSQRSPTPNNSQTPQPPQFPGPSPNAQGSHQAQPASNTPPPPPPSQIQAQTSSSSNSIHTPQTPTFPAQPQGNSTNGSSAGPTPLSPSTDPRDKERIGTLLEINNELLTEAIHMTHILQTIRKERASMNGTDKSSNDGNKKSTEEEQFGHDYYLHCMRRLQTNLAYLAAIVDKPRKPPQISQLYPAFLKPPILNINMKTRKVLNEDGIEIEIGPSDREETAKYFAELYGKLQALFPELDPNKEPPMRPFPQASHAALMQSGSQTPGQSSPVPGKQATPTLASSAPPQPTTMGVSAS
ncbi:hypothetical protein GGS21DRAFT_515902 [Xylaria nigripes]|nr:hypothetical protein GGS21DRAFT_515902 [Xylaria nigripes]